MLVLTKDSANTIRVSLAELSTLASPVYLIEFISDMSLISTTCIAPDTSLYPARFNQFTITEQVAPDGLLAQILLEPVGFFTYNIYEQTSATNLSPDDPGVILLETGKAKVLIDGDRESTAFTYYQNPTPAWAAWDVFESEGIVPAPPSTDATYKNSDDSFVQSIAPGVTYIAPDISFTDSDGTVIPTPANTDIVATPCAAGTIYNRPAPPFGQTTSNFTYDEGWHYQAGTYTTGFAQSSGIVQQLDETDLTRETLVYDNIWSNKQRFTDSQGGQDYLLATNSATDLRNGTQDHLTGLEWINRNAFFLGFSNSSWLNNLTNVNGATLLTQSDWRVPSIAEINTITNQANDPFNNTTYFRITSTVPTCSIRRDLATQYYRRDSAQNISSTGTGSGSTVVALFVRTM